jgi:hypothetical protein
VNDQPACERARGRPGPLPDRLVWDGRVEPEEVRDWLKALRERAHGPEYSALTQLCDERSSSLGRLSSLRSRFVVRGSRAWRGCRR